jgi:hypothetical protein
LRHSDGSVSDVGHTPVRPRRLAAEPLVDTTVGSNAALEALLATM